MTTKHNFKAIDSLTDDKQLLAMHHNNGSNVL